MTPARLLVLLVYAALLVGAVVLGPSLVSSLGADDPTPDAESARPYVASFVSGGGTCVAEVDRNERVHLTETDDGATVVVSGNVPVPDSNYVLDSPRLVAEGDGNYTVELASREATRKPGQGCAVAQTSYELTIRIPEAAGEVSIAVEHDGEVVSRVSTSAASRGSSRAERSDGVSTGDDSADGGVGSPETVSYSSKMRDASVGTNVPMSVTMPMA